MSKITGTVSITGILSKKDTEDAYPLVDQKDIKGGYRVVSDENERENIPSNYLEDGMIVHVLSSSKEYIYKNSIWEEYFGSPDAVEVHIGADEPTQEHIKVWIDDTSATPTEIVNLAEIDDENVSLGSTWSSSKISSEISGIIDDTQELDNKTWSSEKIAEEIAAGGGGGGASIDDDTISTSKTWSSSKINTELSKKAEINDEDMPSPSETWSSVKISDEMSNKADNNVVVKLSGDQTIAGVKTFSAAPVCSVAPTSDTQLVNKEYVDSKVVDLTPVYEVYDQTINTTMGSGRAHVIIEKIVYGKVVNLRVKISNISGMTEYVSTTEPFVISGFLPKEKRGLSEIPLVKPYIFANGNAISGITILDKVNMFQVHEGIIYMMISKNTTSDQEYLSTDLTYIAE